MSEGATADGSTSALSRIFRTVYRTPPGWIRPLVLWVFVGVVALRILVWGFHGLSSLLGIVFLAWLLSIAMEPAVSRLAARGLRRGLATGLVMLTMLVLAVGFFIIFGKLLFDQLVELLRSLPNYVDQTIGWVNDTFNTNLDQQRIQDSLQLDTSKLLGLATNLTGGVFGIVTSVISLIFNGFALLLFAFYMSAEAPQLRATVSSWFPQHQQRVIDTVWGITVQKTGGYLFSRLVLAVLSATFTGVFLLILNIDYWLPLAIWTGLVSQFIPTIGTYLGGALPFLIALLASPLKAALVLAFILVYQQVENYLFSPKVTARTVNIHPAVAFGAVVGGGALFGAWGALVAIPVVAAIQSVADTYGHRYELIPEMKEELDEETTEPKTVTEPTAETAAQQPDQVKQQASEVTSD